MTDDTTTDGEPQRIDREECLAAWREVHDRQPYRNMSEDVYREYKDLRHPSATTFYERFGSWTAAREAVREADDE